MTNSSTIAETRVVHLEIGEIDIENTSFIHQASLRIAPLRRSIEAEGQQIPIIVRPFPGADLPRYQLVSGFRRVTAMKELGLETVAAIIRRDLTDDQAAFRASIIENEQRKTYSDIDRALAIVRCEQAGWSGLDVAELMGLKKRQKNNLERLLDLPEPVQHAIDDPEDLFTATHGIVLGQLARRYQGLDAQRWVDGVNERGLSVAAMRREINRAHKPQGRPPLGSIFNEAATDKTKGVFRFESVKVVVAELTEEERARLRSELQALLGVLG